VLIAHATRVAVLAGSAMLVATGAILLWSRAARNRVAVAAIVFGLVAGGWAFRHRIPVLVVTEERVDPFLAADLDGQADAYVTWVFNRSMHSLVVDYEVPSLGSRDDTHVLVPGEDAPFVELRGIHSLPRPAGGLRDLPLHTTSATSVSK
jgi:hypothetical protein